MLDHVLRRAQRGLVASSAELEDGERRVGVIDAEALAALVATRIIWRAPDQWLPRRLAMRPAAPVRALASRAAHANP